MLMRLLALLAMIVWLTPGGAHAARCDDEHATWEALSEGGIRHTLAIKPDYQVAGSIARIEEWRGGKLIWRLQGEILCSNGDVTCQLSLPNMMDPDNPAKGEDDYTTVVVEQIDDDGDRNADWIVLANLHQKLYYSGGANVEFVNGFGRTSDDERMLAPNVYKFAGCRVESDAPKVDQSDPSRQIVGTLYGIPQLCDAYSYEGKLIPSILGVQPEADFRFGTWWMDDKRVVGGQGDCAIVKKSPDATVELACSGWGQTWTETRKYSEKADVRRIGNVKLRRCKG
jgi:hypothetical protein